MDIYKKEILDHSRFPRNLGKINNPDVCVTASNTSCGDEIDLYLKIDKQSKITDIKYCCHGCALSTASSSLLSEVAKGKSLTQIQKLNIDDMYKILGAKISKGRNKCVTLGLNALQKAIKNYSNKKKSMPKTKKLSKITKNTNIAQLISQHPDLGQVLVEDYGLHCVGCFAAAYDTLEQGAKNHGFSDKQIKEMVENLNDIISHKTS